MGFSDKSAGEQVGPVIRRGRQAAPPKIQAPGCEQNQLGEAVRVRLRGCLHGQAELSCTSLLQGRACFRHYESDQRCRWQRPANRLPVPVLRLASGRPGGSLQANEEAFLLSRPVEKWTTRVG